MFTAGVDGLIYIESVDAPGAAGDDFAAAGQDDRGPVVSFDDPGSNDADHAFMPMRLVEDGGSAVRVGGFLFKDGEGFLGHAAVGFLAVGVVGMQLTGVGQRELGIGFDEEVDDFPGVVHSSGGVDAGGDHEYEVDHLERSGQAAQLDEGADAIIGVLIDFLQAVPGEDPVLAVHGDDIGGDSGGDEVEVLEGFFRRESKPRREGGDQFVADAATAKFFVRIGAAGLLGVQDGDGGRELVVGQVVVADNEVDSQCGGIGDEVD